MKFSRFRFVEILTVIFFTLEVIAFLLGFSFYSNPVLAGVFLFALVSYVAITNMLGKGGKYSFIGSLLWSILVLGPLGRFFGIIEVIIYWFLFFHNKSTSSSSSTSTSGSSSANPNVIRKHARIPFLRIPILWITYTLDLKNNTFTRDSLFPGRHHKGQKISLIGRDDDLPLKQVFDWDFSNSLYRILSGTFCFEFQSKKIGHEGDKKLHWHCIPVEFLEQLRSCLRDLNK